MPDDRSDVERGWQNVLRVIRQHLNTYTTRPYEQPLSPVEEWEEVAWQTAHDAVLNGLAAVDGDDAD